MIINKNKNYGYNEWAKPTNINKIQRSKVILEELNTDIEDLKL